MSETVSITVLVENTVNARGLLAEHGLAFHVRAGRNSLLFDTGQTDLLLRNAQTLGLNLAEVQAIALSHGHDDHSGGIEVARRAAPHARLFLHPAAAAPKFARNPNGSVRPIGMREAPAQSLGTAGGLLVLATRPTEVLPGIFVTGEIPRQNSFEDTGGPFFLDPACTQPDPLIDDQALFFDSPDGLVVLVGCAHAGVVNTLEHIEHVTGGRPVYALLGGFHLHTASPDRMIRTVEALRNRNIQRLAPGHCTGLAALTQLWAAFPGRCLSCAVGTRLSFRQ